MRDTLFNNSKAIEPFRFNDAVVQVFPDMIQRSVPGYGAMLELLTSLSSQYLQENTTCYDLGCSLGAVSVLLSQRLAVKGISIHAVDNSASMITQLNARLDQFEQLNIPIITHEADILAIDFAPCSLVILNLTLQFIEQDQRDALIQRIYDKMTHNGAIIICDKVHFDDNRTQKVQNQWHEQFKRLQGYNELEISQKRAAIMNVLRTDTPEQQCTRLEKAGFSHVNTWFQAFSFMGFIGVKA
ncbi:MAG: carboxy-S-adenosyl-L-methionine synthase CmoA [Pseudomonadota bacterium]|nr:carboxy-S-adenosyl-L-methionine synthase CmoA [Pseudomonadota bacterium]